MIDLWDLKIEIYRIFRELSDLFFIFFILLTNKGNFRKVQQRGQLKDNKKKPCINKMFNIFFSIYWNR